MPCISDTVCMVHSHPSWPDCIGQPFSHALLLKADLAALSATFVCVYCSVVVVYCHTISLSLGKPMLDGVARRWHSEHWCHAAGQLSMSPATCRKMPRSQSATQYSVPLAGWARGQCSHPRCARMQH